MKHLERDTNGEFLQLPRAALEFSRLLASDFLQLSDVFPGPGFDSRANELKDWFVAKGIWDFEAVPLDCDAIGKVSSGITLFLVRVFETWAQESVRKIEELADQLLKDRPPIKKARVDGVPRQAVLKPAHAIYRLQNQRFEIGDRVVMVRDSGSVPLSTKGVVIGINVKSLDVVWDVTFMSGSTLGDKFVTYPDGLG